MRSPDQDVTSTSPNLPWPCPDQWERRVAVLEPPGGISCSLRHSPAGALTDRMIPQLLCVSSILLSLTTARLSTLMVSSLLPANIFNIRCWIDNQGIVLQDENTIIAEFKVWSGYQLPFIVIRFLLFNLFRSSRPDIKQMKLIEIKLKIKFKIIKKIHPGVWLRTGRWKTEKLSEGNKKSGWDLADIQELWLRVSALLFTTLMSFTLSLPYFFSYNGLFYMKVFAVYIFYIHMYILPFNLPP